MANIVVEIMPKPVLLDPQGKAVTSALERLGKTHFSGVRVGKRFEMSVEGPVTEAVLEEARQIAEEVFANPAIEDVVNISVSEA